MMRGGNHPTPPLGFMPEIWIIVNNNITLCIVFVKIFLLVLLNRKKNKLNNLKIIHAHCLVQTIKNMVTESSTETTTLKC